MANVETVARAMNLTPRRVQQLVAEGMPKAERGEYDLGQCMAWYIRFLQKALEARQDPDQRQESAELSRERARLAREQADRTALQNAEMRGDLGRLSVWEQELQVFLTEIRAAFLRLPTKVAPLLHGDTDQRKQTLDGAVADILEQLAAYRPSARKPRNSSENRSRGGGAKATASADSKPMGRPRTEAQQRKQRRTGAMAH